MNNFERLRNSIKDFRDKLGFQSTRINGRMCLTKVVAGKNIIIQNPKIDNLELIIDCELILSEELNDSNKTKVINIIKQLDRSNKINKILNEITD